MNSKYSNAREAIKDKIRYVQDFPEDGVLFEDLTPVLADADAFSVVIDGLADECEKLGADLIAGLDARSFLLGSAAAYKLGTVLHQEYSLEYGSAALEIPADGAVITGAKIALVDDVLATGGTLAGARQLLESAGAEVVGAVVVLEVEGLGGREKFGNLPISVLNATTE